MGYDLYLLEPPERLEPQRRRYREALDRWQALTDRPFDDPEHRAAWEAHEATADPDYLRLDVTSMGMVRVAMSAAGMLATDGQPSGLPDWRSVPAKRLDGGPFDPDSPYPDELCTPEQIAFMDALDRWRRYRPPGNVGTQAWELRSNDDWIVTADECAEALAAWATLSPGRRQALLWSVATMDTEEADPSVRPWRGDLVRMFETMGERDGEDPPPVVVADVHRPAIDDFVAVWDAWLAFLRLGAEGDGFMVD